MKYNHMFDIGFSVVSECEDPMECITDEPQLIREALLKRIAGLTDDELSEALGHCDTYEDRSDWTDEVVAVLDKYSDENVFCTNKTEDGSGYDFHGYAAIEDGTDAME